MTARESRSPITRKLSVPELGRRRSARAPKSYFGAFLPEMEGKSQAGARGLFPRAGDAVGPSLGTAVPGTAMLQSPCGAMVPGRSRDGDTAAKAGSTPAVPFWGAFVPSRCPSVTLRGQEQPSARKVLPSSPARPAAPQNLLLEPKAAVKS